MNECKIISADLVISFTFPFASGEKMEDGVSVFVPRNARSETCLAAWSACEIIPGVMTKWEKDSGP